MKYYGGKELARSFRVVRKNTLVIAEEIPEQHYSFRPSPASRSVAEILSHIAVSSRANYENLIVEHIQTFIGLDFQSRMRERSEAERKLVAREEILAAVWGQEAYLDERTVDVHVRWLRQKLEPDAERPRYIETVRGIGYRFGK